MGRSRAEQGLRQDRALGLRMPWAPYALGWSPPFSWLPGGTASPESLRILVIVHDGTRTQSSQQRAQEALVLWSQTQDSTAPFWGPQGCFL